MWKTIVQTNIDSVLITNGNDVLPNQVDNTKSFTGKYLIGTWKLFWLCYQKTHIYIADKDKNLFCIHLFVAQHYRITYCGLLHKTNPLNRNHHRSLNSFQPCFLIVFDGKKNSLDAFWLNNKNVLNKM